jgi:hypothetical protein
MKMYSHLFVVLPVLLGFCAKQDSKDTLARIGNSVIDKSQFESFEKAIRIYPSKQNDVFPAGRSPVTFMVESEILSSKASAELKNTLSATPDWQWKKRFYPAQFFLFDNLVPNLGATDEQLKTYYNAHKDSFKVTIKAPDSLKKDSVHIKDFAEVKEEIANKLFLLNNKPEAAFLKALGDTLPSAQIIHQNWISYARNSAPQFFMKKFYAEDFGKPYPDSLSEIFGKGKLITQEDMDVILSWIPAERRDYYSNDQGKRELVEWLLKWKLFSAHAEKSGFTKQPLIKKGLDWAWKIEVATEYVTKELLPKAQGLSKPIDSMMVKFAYTDEAGAANLNPDTSELNRRFEAIKVRNSISSIDSQIYSIRKKVGVTFSQAEWSDGKSQDPVKLIAKADSLRDSVKAEEAERIYTAVSTDFSFTPEGKRALIELAKILTERQAYSQAITNYRNYLISGEDKSKFCNVFFMIGFIYDEYLDKPELAEINYKYVLKNLPGCELTDDAEFMMLHLGEPMSSIEELQSEALRQGRKIEPADGATAK